MNLVNWAKHPISSIPTSVYLKECKHSFDREKIKKLFNETFRTEDVVLCPTCDRNYSIIGMLSEFETREEAIAAFFERQLKVSVISRLGATTIFCAGAATSMLVAKGLGAAAATAGLAAAPAIIVSGGVAIAAGGVVILASVRLKNAFF